MARIFMEPQYDDDELSKTRKELFPERSFLFPRKVTMNQQEKFSSNNIVLSHMSLNIRVSLKSS